MPSSRPFLATALLALALPGAASAATITVNPGDDPQAKVASAAAGDTVLFKAGTHSGTVSTATANLTLQGEPGAVLVAPSTATGATPTLAFTAASGGADKVVGLTIANQVTTGPVIAGGMAGLTVQDALVFSSTGNGLQFGGGTNLLQRATIVTLFATGRAVTIDSATGDGAKTLTADSSILVGKYALSSAYASPTVAGAGVIVTARHVTAIGAVVADATQAPALGASPIGITFLDSIIRGTRVPATGTGTVGASITADIARNSVADTAADAASVFVKPGGFNYHLRADAPVLDKGQITSGESTTDVDGDPRTAGSASDYGADEFVNKAPTASLTGPTGTVRQNAAATFSASKSTDPEATFGGGIASYHWDFGDGSTADTTTPTTTHTYTGRQAYSVTVAVTDKQGLASAASSPVSVTVLDGVPPTLTIGSPKNKQKLKIYKTKRLKSGKIVLTKKRLKVSFFGGAQDDTAMGKVLMALRPLGLSKGKCRWFDGKTSLKTGACTAPILIQPTFLNGGWRYSLPLKAKIPAGPYALVVAAVDASGLSSAVQTVTFRLK